MIRKIIKIDGDKCDGCGLCVTACHEDAIGLVNGKATLLRDDYCDGLGDCLPTCPTGAISFVEREALAFNKEEVLRNMAKKKIVDATSVSSSKDKASSGSALMQWPVQIKLVAPNAPFFQNADLLIAADCVAYAYKEFHKEFMNGKITLIGCPKLDEGDYAEKLATILSQNDISSLTVARMKVPCCSGIVNAVKRAFEISGKIIPWSIVTISTDGHIL